MGYPRFLTLDGWGRPLEVKHRAFRSPAERFKNLFAAAADAAAIDSPPPPARVLPKELADTLPKGVQERVKLQDPDARAGAWLPFLETEGLSPRALTAIYNWEEDPLVRTAVIEKLGKAKRGSEQMELLSQAMGATNDYVRSAALKEIRKVGGPEAAKIIAGIILKVLPGRSGFENPNNMLCEAAEAAADVAETSLIEPLESIVKQEGLNNSATFLAVKALIGIGKRHGMKMVVGGLEAALKKDGTEAMVKHMKELVEPALDEARNPGNSPGKKSSAP